MVPDQVAKIDRKIRHAERMRECLCERSREREREEEEIQKYRE